MKCDMKEPILSAYLDGELSEAERLAVRTHLAGCAACRKTLQDLSLSKKLVAGLGRAEPAPFFETRVMSRIRERSAAPRGLREFIATERIAAIAAAGVLALAVVLNLSLFPAASNAYAQMEQYVLQGAPESDGTTVVTQPEVSEDDILSLAFGSEEA